MKHYRADLHIHSMLSPCGDIEMSPKRIIAEARKRKIDILGITDHNSTLHCRNMVDLGKDEGVFVLPGVEVNTKEEIHCLAFFENADIADRFQEFLESKLPFIPNNTDLFGHQFIVDKDTQILGEVETLLIGALEADIYEVSGSVRRLGGIFIPAHIDRPYSSIISQLGSVPPDLEYDALEVSARYAIKDYAERHPEYNKQTLITNSDAHHPDLIGRATTMFEIEKCTFTEVAMALRKENNRKTARE